MWDAIRVRRRFDLAELMMIAGTNRRTATGYVGLLQRCGYVQREHLACRWKGDQSIFRLVRYPGRKAPRETIRVVDGRNVREMVDPNSGVRHDLTSRKRKSDPVADGGVG